MEEFYNSFALISCGASLAMGCVYRYRGSIRKSMTYILFGVLGISLFVFFLMPNVIFILDDTPPYTPALLLKRLFIFTYYGVIPWFICTTPAILRNGLRTRIRLLPEFARRSWCSRLTYPRDHRRQLRQPLRSATGTIIYAILYRRLSIDHKTS